MSHAAEILNELQRRGVNVAIEGDTLCLRPRRALDDTLLARVREAKPAIIETLRGGPVLCVAARQVGCFEKTDQVKILRPKIGKDHRQWFEHWKGDGNIQ